MTTGDAPRFSRDYVDSLCVGTNANGRLEIFFLEIGNTSTNPPTRLWHAPIPDNGWNGWNDPGLFSDTESGGQPEPCRAVWNPVMAQNADGYLELFVRGTSGTDSVIWHICQVTGPVPVASLWASLGPPGLPDAPPVESFWGPAVVRNADGCLEVFVWKIGTGEVWHKWQTAPSGDWSDWAPLGCSVRGGEYRPSLAVARNADGRLELFTSGTDHPLWHISQTAPDGDWSDWAPLGGDWAEVARGSNVALAVAQNADGRLELFAPSPDSVMLWHIWQTAPGGDWSDWATLTHPDWATPRALSFLGPAVVRNADGRLEVFVYGIGTDSPLCHISQTAPNGDWSNWAAVDPPS